MRDERTGPAEQVRVDRWIAALAAAMAAHVVLGLLWPREPWTTSAGMTLSLGVTIAFSVAQARRAERAMRWRWALLTAALMLWLGAYGAIGYLQSTVPPGQDRLPIDELCYVLRAVPYLLLFARAGDVDTGGAFRRIDIAQALLLMALLTLLLLRNLFGLGARLPDTDAIWYHERLNIGVAILAAIGTLGTATAAKRRFAIALAAMLGVYAVSSLAWNHLVLMRLPPPPPGNPANASFALPFVALMLAYRHALGREPVLRPGSATSVMVRQFRPMAFAFFNLLAAVELARAAPVAGIGAALFAQLLYGLRSALLQRQLEALRAFVAGVVEHLPDAVCVLGAGRRVRLGNAAALRLFGQPPAGSCYDDLVARLEGQRAGDGALELADGRILVEACAPLPHDETICRLTDVSHLRRMEEDREQALEFLSHDLRAPYVAILALLDGSGRGVDFGRIRNQAERGLELADGFVRLARARSSAAPHALIDLADVIVQAADMVWPMAHARGTRLVQHGPTAPALILGDELLMVRAVYNLLENGVKYGPGGTTLDFGLVLREDRSEMWVASLGADLPEGRGTRPFARFGASGDRSGVGLGLALVEVAAQAHGGTVRHCREDGRHVFTIALAPAVVETHDGGDEPETTRDTGLWLH